ncbi:hypothetical protein AciM339_0454 [Aciduliprofundum sp. MAR08-339]|uniref:hypothetical protein n=1 Tax=Aciduliprofundum sp. (strain MAR08-339) TaxID=673860 RepID=UPI0002A4A186|nr:hypothetical protein AciM339_0454 [Aciduliprofundum sp. MAR08-339]
MKGGELKDRVEYLTSLRILTSDKYGIWGLDPLLFIPGLFLMALGIGNPYFPTPWRLGIIILGAVMLIASSIRIEKRFSPFKRKILEEIEKCENI